MNDIDLFGVRMHALAMDETLELIKARLASGEFTQHVVVNVAKVVNMQSDAALSEAVAACDVINIDGMGVVWGARLSGHAVPERVAGIDLFYELLKYGEEARLPVYFLGATQEVVDKAVANLAGLYPDLLIAGWHHGYFWDDEEAVVAKVRQSGAAMLFVAITSPKKEQFINRWKEQLGVNFAMGVGGTFDIVAGKSKRAPVWMQKSGLEWFCRVIQEPRRMWRRYLVTNVKFLIMLVQQKLRFPV